MVVQEAVMEIAQPLTLEQRRAFHQLPLAERRRLLAQQAEHAAVYYEEAKAAKEREEWQGGDIIEC